MILAMITQRSGYLRSYASSSKNSSAFYKKALRASLCAVFFVAGCRGNTSADYSSLNPPYALSTAAAPAMDSRAQPACPRPMPPVKDLMLGGVYKKSDPTRSEIDEDAQKIYQGQTAKLNSFENRLSALTNDYLKTNKKDGRSAYCALDWLYTWAAADAFLGEVNVQGGYARQWSLGTLSSSYMQVRDFPFDENKKVAIEKWLLEIAGRVMNDYADISTYIRKQNNHLYWAAWAITETGIATDHRELYDWGVGKVKYALHVQVQNDGTLPLELIRGQKALQYHVFALVPLVMVSEAAMNNGEDLYEVNDGALHKLVTVTFEGLKDSSYFEKLTNHKQISSASMSDGHFSWLEAYNARFPAPEYEAFLKQHRPIVSRRTGGDMTFLYGRSLHSPPLRPALEPVDKEPR
jgi:poly(beta-D-mannuronate) lyase